jgi:hypothetical protein
MRSPTNFGASTRPWILVALAWTFAQGLSLFYPHALFWDDWLLYQQSPIPFSDGQDLWPRRELESFLLDIHPGSFRLLTFLLFPLIALLVWSIAGRFLDHGLTRREQHLFGLLVLFLPANSARISNITFGYSLALAAFVVATWLWTRNRSFLFSTLALVLLLFSFRTSSLLSFSLLTSVVGYKIDTSVDHSPRRVTLIRNSLPVLLAVVYRLFISDNGVSPGYNEFRLGGLLRATLLLLGFAGMIGLLIASRKRLELSSAALRQLAFGLFVLWLGAMPYMSVGHLSSLTDWTTYFLPGEGDWHSRHQLLLPFGFALTLIGLFNLLEGKVLQLLTPLVLMISVLVTFLYSVEYFVDAKKQDAVIRALQADEGIREAKFVYVQDDSSAARLNARGRSYREYEFDGMLRRAYSGSGPRFLDEQFTDGTVCSSPSEIPLVEVYVNYPQLAALRTLISGDPYITLDVSNLQACLKPEYRP